MKELMIERPNWLVAGSIYKIINKTSYELERNKNRFIWKEYKYIFLNSLSSYSPYIDDKIQLICHQELSSIIYISIRDYTE